MSQQDPNDVLSKITQHLAVAQTYLGKVAVMVAEYQDSVAPMPLHGSAIRSSNTAIHSLQMWAEHLAENGPTARGALNTITGLNLTKSGYDRTHAWVGPMTYMPDDAFPADAVLRIKGLSNGVGRPPVIFFLWSQRWDVRPKFGAGPTKPENLPAPVDGSHLHQSDLTHDEAGGLEPVHEWLLESPADNTPDDAVTDSLRYASMDEWNEAWSPSLRVLAADGVKPSDEVKQRMLASLPVGQEGQTTIAMAYSAAARQSTPLLGVVMPPPLEDILEAGWSNDDTVPVPEPDRSDWEMVGNHNHLPHPWTDFCAVSRCQRMDGPVT